MFLDVKGAKEPVPPCVARRAQMGQEMCMTSLNLRLLVATTSLLLWATSLGCADPYVGDDPPLDTPTFPTGLAVHPDGDFLAVVSSNFDGRYNRGALLLAPLDDVRIAAANATEMVRLDNTFKSAAFVPTFGHQPVFSPNGDRLVLATREANLLVEIGVDDDLTITCPVRDGEETPDCETTPFALSLPANDPYDLVVTSQSDTEVRGVVSFLEHHEVMPFIIRDDEDGDRRFRIDTARIVDLGEDVAGVQAMTLLPGTSFVVLAVERFLSDSSTLRGIELIAYDLNEGANAALHRLDVDIDTGVFGVRTLVASPDGGSLFMLTQLPDGLLRFDVDDGAIPTLTFSGQMETCSSPSRLLQHTLEAGNGDQVERLFLTCFDDDAVLLIEPHSLSVTDEVRFLGDGPFGMALDVSGDEPLLFVSYFLDHRVVAFDLIDDVGEVRLTPVVELSAPAVDPLLLPLP